MTTRRALLCALGAGAVITGSSPARGQQPTRIPRVGMLWFIGSNESARIATDMFRQRLTGLGYVEGKTILIDERFAEGNMSRLNELAREFVRSKVDIIVTTAVAATIAARQATSTLPIVMLNASNPIGAGLIESLARPGGNVTGISNVALGGKLVEVLRELVPRLGKLAILANPTNAGVPPARAEIADTARRFNISVVVVAEVTRAEDFPNAFAAIRSAGPDGLLVLADPLVDTRRTEVIDFVASAKLPTIYDNGSFTRPGGLISYSAVFLESYALAAVYVDKILKGAKPADLPVQQPTKFALIINLKTAKALGITIPQTLLVRADNVIE